MTGCLAARSARQCGALACDVALDGSVHGRAGDPEQDAELRNAVLAGAMKSDQVGLLATLTLGCLPRKRPLAFATLMPSRIRSRMRSPSDSATMASTLNSTATSFLTVYPTAQPQPLAANLNYLSGDTVSNRVMTAPASAYCPPP